MPRVLVPLAMGFEELEAVTVIDLLRRAGIEVCSAGLTAGPVRGSRGTVIVPDMALDEALQHAYDMVVLPGGQPGSNNLKADVRIIALVQRMAAAGQYTAALCAAPTVLAAAGVLQGKRATAFPGSLERMALADVSVVTQTVVVDGQVITSRGPGTAMDFALTLIELLLDTEKRNEVEVGLVRGA